MLEIETMLCVRDIHFKLSLKISAGSRHLILLDKTKITPLFWELHVLLSLMGGKFSKKFLNFKSTIFLCRAVITLLCWSGNATLQLCT